MEIEPRSPPLHAEPLEKEMATNSNIVGASLVVAQMVKILGQENLLKKRMATHSSILAWRIPTERGVWLGGL